MPARDFARNSGAISVLITDTLVLSANPSRMEFTVTNDHATQVVYLMLQKAPTRSSDPPASTAAVANQGIRLNAAGGSYTTQNFRGEVRAISVGGTSVVTVVEL